MEVLNLHSPLFINIYSCLHAAGKLSDFFAIECSKSEGYKCSPMNSNLTNIVTHGLMHYVKLLVWIQISQFTTESHQVTYLHYTY